MNQDFEDIETVNKITLSVNFYDFLGINNNYFHKICKEFGRYLANRSNRLDIDDFTLCKIIEHYPSLYYVTYYYEIDGSVKEGRYNFIDISENFREDLKNNIYKYIAPDQAFIILDNPVKSMENFCFFGNYKMIKYLHKHKKISQHNFEGLLHIACCNGHFKIVKFMYEKFREKIKLSRCFIEVAARSRNFRIFEYIYKIMFEPEIIEKDINEWNYIHSLRGNIITNIIFDAIDTDFDPIIDWAYQKGFCVNINF